jgi:hypothetical protein
VFNNGGKMTSPKTMPAFASEQTGAPGIAIRDYFAAAATSGLLSTQQRKAGTADEHGQVAVAVYRYADAMTAARGLEKA